MSYPGDGGNVRRGEMSSYLARQGKRLSGASLTTIVLLLFFLLKMIDVVDTINLMMMI